MVSRLLWIQRQTCVFGLNVVPCWTPLFFFFILCFWGHYDIFFVCLFFSLVDIITKHVFLLPFSFSFLIALVFIDFSCDSDGHDADCEEEDATCLFIWLLHVG